MDLMEQSNIDFKAEIKVATQANAHDLFGSYIPLLDSLCKGFKCDLSLDAWKGFALS